MFVKNYTMTQLTINKGYYPPEKVMQDLLFKIEELTNMRNNAWQEKNLDKANKIGAHLDLLEGLKDIITIQAGMISGHNVNEERKEIKKLLYTIKQLKQYIQFNGLNPNAIRDYHGNY